MNIRKIIGLGCGLLLAGFPTARADLAALWTFDSALAPSEGISDSAITGNAVTGSNLQPRIGRGCYFGNNGGYAAAFGYNPNTSSAWSISAWFRTDADNGTTDTLCGWYVMPGFVTHVLRRNSNNLFFQVGTTGYQWPASQAFNGQWHHAVVCSSPSGGPPLTMYLDGVALPAPSTTSAGFGADFENRMRIGTGLSRSVTTNHDWDGWIDDFGVFGNSISPMEAALIHGLGGHGIGLGEFSVARALALAPAGTTTHIAGRTWIRVASGLAGAVGSAGGSLAAGDASVVLASGGSGIRMADPPSPLREFTNLPPRFDVVAGTGRTHREILEIANPSTVAALNWDIVAQPGETPALVAIDKRIDATLPGVLAVASGLTAEVPPITAKGEMLGSAYAGYAGNGHRFKPSFASSIVDIPLKSVPGIYRQEYQASGKTAAINYLNRTGPGYFLMSADCQSIAELEISGNFPVFPGPDKNVFSMELTVHGIPWKLWIYRISAVERPIIHHLFLTPPEASITGGIPLNYGESFRLSGLPESCRVHHLWLIRDFEVFSENTLLEIARSFLRASHAPTFWIRPAPPSGKTASAGTTETAIDFDSTGLPAGIHESRFAVIPAGTDVSEAPESRYHDARINVLAPEFTAAVSTSEIALLPGYAQKTGKILLNPASGFSFSAISAVAAAPWLRAVPSENRIGEIDLTIDTTGLAEGTYETTVTISAGQTTQTVIIKIRIWPPSYSQLIADPYRNRVYLLHDGSAAHKVGSRILVVDAVKGTVVREIDAGLAYQMAQSPDGGRLFTLQRPENSIVPIDLLRMEAQAAVLMPDDVPLRTQAFGNLQAGPGGVIYFINRSYAGKLFAVNTQTGTVIQQIDTPPNATSYHDKLRVSADGAMLIASVNVSDTFDGPFESLVRYRIETDGRLTALPPTDHALLIPPSLTSSYLLQISASGRQVSVGDRLFSPGRFKETMRHFESNIEALAPDGEFVVCNNAVYNAAGSVKLRDMPSLTTQIVVSAEGNIFHTNKTSFGFIDAIAEFGADAGFRLVPEDGTFGPPAEYFRWIPVDGTREYRVHFSKNPAALTTATPGTGTVTIKTRHHWVTPPVMAAGETWHWRVDAVSPAGLLRGPVRVFTATAWGNRLPRIEIDVAKGCTNQPLPLDFLRPPSPSPVDFLSDQPWLKPTGLTDPARAFEIDARLMSGDSSEATITITAEGRTIKIPVFVRIHPCDHVALIADRSSSRAFALLRSSRIIFQGTTSQGPYFIVRIDPSNGELRECRQVGFGDGKLILSNDGRQIGISYPATGVNLRTGGVDVFDSARLERLAGFWRTSKDINSISPSALGPNDLLAIDSSLMFNWRTGQQIAHRGSTSITLSPTVFSPDGRFLYSGNHARIYRYDATSPTLPLINSVAVSSGTAPMISLDGSRLALGGTVFDAELNPVAEAGEVIHALSGDAKLLVTRNELRHVPSMRMFATDAFGPFDNDNIGFCDFTGTLMYYRWLGSGLNGVPIYRIFRYDTLLHINASDIIPATADGSVIADDEWTPKWSDLPAAASYRVFFGEDPAELAAAAAGSPLELGVTITSSWPNALPLSQERTYYWKVIAEGPGGTAESAVWSFRTSGFRLGKTSLSLSSPYEGPSFTSAIPITTSPTKIWTLATNTPWIRLPVASGTGSGEITLEIDPAGLSTSIHGGSFTVTVGGDSAIIPVSLDCFRFQLMEIVADPDEPVIHMLATRVIPFSSGQKEDLFLIKYDSRTQQPLGSLSLGVVYQSSSVLRIFTHRQDNRVYVYPGASGRLLGVNRQSYNIETNVPVSAVPTCAAGPGRVAVLNGTGPVIYSSSTGLKLLDPPPGLSGLALMAAPPSGDRLYCASSGSLRSFLLFEDRIEAGPVATSTVGSSGRLGVSADGMTVFYRDGYHDRDLRLLGQQSKILTTNSDGSLFLLSDSSTISPSKWMPRNGGDPQRPDVQLYNFGTKFTWSPVNQRFLGRIYSNNIYQWTDPVARENLGLPVIPGGEWTAEGARPWTRDLSSSPGVVRSGRLGDPSSSYFTNSTALSFKSPAGGTFAFDWRNLTNGGERIRVLVNGSEAAMLNASANWQSRSLAIPAGATVVISYNLPSGSAGTAPAAELRNLSFTSLANAPADVTADSDGDGVEDLLEASLGSDPADCNCRPVYGIGGRPDAPEFHYQRPISAAWSYRVQVSDDLSKWVDLPDPPVIETRGTMESVTHALPPGRARVFVRIHATQVVP